MNTTVRAFVREFAKIRDRADAGEIIRVRGRDATYVFRVESRAGAGLLGCCASMAPKVGSKPGPVETPSAWRADR